MKIFIWIALILVSLYSFGFTISLWRDKKRLGSVAVLSLAAATIIVAFLGALK
ncbi:hypothetical protein [Cytobacillus sp.]|uniref:hypothetical protein n=1 Tax=Cytobacillus sp. TaxID=2675269 RepID=UPI0028BDE3A1|nr:hypothetical protein [Cytobacillus sp.]